MKSNQEILDEFGKKIVNNILDRYYRGIKKELNEGIKNPIEQEYNTIFKSLTEKQKKYIYIYIKENINSILFDFLNFFEENEQFKLIYEESGKQVDLVKISEMLKAEPIIENGWIKRFSKYADEYEE